MPLNFLYIQYFSAQRKDGLRVSVAALLGRTTGRIALDEEYFTFLRVFVRTVGKLAGQSAAAHHALTLHAFACLSCGYTCRGSEYNLFANHLCLGGMLLKIVGQCLPNGLIYSACDLTVT